MTPNCAKEETVNVHEYQAKELLREYGVAVPPGAVAKTPAEAEEAARGLAKGTVVVKAQVHAGGRGKAGGIKLAKSPAEAKQAASEILGMTLRSHQTGPEGKLVRTVYVESASEVEHEYYLGIVLDRAEEKLAIIASTEGGMEIEEVAAKTPEKIITVGVENATGLTGFAVRQIGFGLGLDAAQVVELVGLAEAHEARGGRGSLHERDTLRADGIVDSGPPLGELLGGDGSSCQAEHDVPALPRHETGVHLCSHYEHVTVLLRPYQCVGELQAVEEARALLADIQARDFR